MKGYNLWSHTPYRQLVDDGTDIYICRVVPYTDKIHFEWLGETDLTYSVYYRRRDEGEFIHFTDTTSSECDITGLECDTDYEFYIKSGNEISRTRLARCGDFVGTTVNYLHPDDNAYGFSGNYLCSPSLVKHPDGRLFASMDVYGCGTPQNLSFIFRSDDNGQTWHYVSELIPCFWGKLFFHKGDLYMLACSTEYGDLLIGKSSDDGKTFSPPVTLLKGSNGKNGNEGIHKNPQNILYRNGRIYTTLEWGTWSNNKSYDHAAMVMSCNENDDLLVPENWSFTEPKIFSPEDAPELASLSTNATTIEGTLVVSPENKILNIMRFEKEGCAIVYELNPDNCEAVLRYSYCMEFNAHASKFMIKYDSKTKKYITIADYIYDKHKYFARNYLVLMASSDLKKWDIVCDLLDFRDEDAEKIGFQYIDFEFDNDDIIYLSRTAFNNANSYHNSNYSTFHRIKNFRELID